MKNLLLTVGIIIWATSISFAEEKIPAEVKTAFNKMYPNIEKVKWDKEKGNEYEAEFKKEGIEYTVSFNSGGSMVATEVGVMYDELPDKAKAHLALNYSKHKVLEVEKIVIADGTQSYEVEVRKWLKKEELNYDAIGKLIQLD